MDPRDFFALLLRLYLTYCRLAVVLLFIWQVHEGDSPGAYFCYFLNLLAEAYDVYLDMKADQSESHNVGE